MVSKYKVALEEMLWQFAYRIVRDNKQYLVNGGLSALEEAFDVMGWDNPHYIPSDDMITCNIDGCFEWSTSGQIWGDLYLRLCSKHGHDCFLKLERPHIKQSVILKESKRDKITGILHE